MPLNRILPWRLLVRILPVVLVSFLVIGMGTLAVIRSRIEDAADSQAQAEHERKSTKLRTFLEARDAEVRELASLPLFMDYFFEVAAGLEHEANNDRERLNSHFRTFLERNPSWQAVRLYDLSGRPVAAARRPSKGAAASTRRYSIPISGPRGRTAGDLQLECSLDGAGDAVEGRGRSVQESLAPLQGLDILIAACAVLGALMVAGWISWRLQEATRKAELQALNRQIADSEKLTVAGRLTSGIAHELKTPLQNVIGYAQMIARQAEGAPSEDLSRLEENALRCRRIIDNLLLFVRQSDSGKAPVALSEVATRTLDLLQFRLQREADIDVRVELSSLPEVRGDFQQLEQVFVNLVCNAADALASTDPPRHIRISGSAREGVLRVVVSDNGTGVLPPNREKLFAPFFTTKPAGSGTGLGLAICRNIIQDHQGRMGFEPRPEGGSRFWFELPVLEGVMADGKDP